MLSSEYQIIENQLPDEQPVKGVYLLNYHLIVYGTGAWAGFNMRAEKQDEHLSSFDKDEWPILCK